MLGPKVRVPAVVLGVLFVHEALLRPTRIDGVRPDLMLGLAVVAGVVGGAERGAVTGFLAGLASDLFLSTPFGLSALVFCVVGYTVGVLQSTVLPQARASVPIVTLFASAVGVVGFALVGSVLGQPAMVTPHLVTIALVVGMVNSLVSLPIAVAARWSQSGRAAVRVVRSLA